MILGLVSNNYKQALLNKRIEYHCPGIPLSPLFISQESLSQEKCQE